MVASTSDDLAWLDATAVAALIRGRQITAQEAVEAAITRIERLDPQFDAVVDTCFDRARAEASGALADAPFSGVPFLLKDVGQYRAGDRYQHGMRFLRDHEWRAPYDTELARRFVSAGFVQLGRAKTPELSLAPTTEPLAFGPARNPWAPERSTGGSSGGSAAAVASGMVPVAHASDSGGSIRIPAAACGLVGLKPSRDRGTFAPDLAQHWGPLTHEHCLARTVRDSAAVLDAIAGAFPGDLHRAPPPARPWADEVTADPGALRIGVVTGRPDGEPVDAACIDGVRRTAELLESMGHHVEDIDGGFLADAEGGTAYVTVLGVSLAHDIDLIGRDVGQPVSDLEPFTQTIVDMGRATSGPAYFDALDALARWSRRMAAAQAAYDVVVTPTLAIAPPPLGVAGPPEPDLTATVAMAVFCMPFNVSGQPALSLPLHHSDGIPVGIQFIADYGREDLLFRVAGRLEEACPWADRRPPDC